MASLPGDRSEADPEEPTSINEAPVVSIPVEIGEPSSAELPIAALEESAPAKKTRTCRQIATGNPPSHPPNTPCQSTGEPDATSPVQFFGSVVRRAAASATHVRWPADCPAISTGARRRRAGEPERLFHGPPHQSLLGGWVSAKLQCPAVRTANKDRCSWRRDQW